MDTESHEFDAFISYSHTDSAWVKPVLIPRLKDFGIRYAVDYEDFDLVRPFNSDISRLTSISRCTLVVLTKYWTASPYADFESQLAQVIKRQIVALRTDECEVPGILRDAEILDMTSGDEEQTWARLRHALLPPQRPPRDFGAGIEIWRAYSGRTGYEYAADVVVNNAPGPALVFDSIELAAFAPRSAERQDAVASVTRVLFIEGGGVSIVTSFDEKMADPTVCRIPPPRTPFSTQPHSWLSEELLLSSRLDGNLAYILARDSGCEGVAEGGSALFLKTIVIDGVWRPLWHVPFKLKGCDQTAVSADTGELFWCIKDEWAKVGGALWNS